MIRRKTSAEDGFTLVELLITVVIIAILTAIAVPSYMSVVATTQDSAAQSNLDSVDSAQNIYSTGVGAGKFASTSSLASSGVLNLAGTNGKVDTVSGSGCYISGSKSDSGAVFYRTSRGERFKGTIPNTSWCIPAAWLFTSPVTNLVSNPAQSVGMTGYGTFGAHTLTWTNGANGMGKTGYITSAQLPGNGDGRAVTFGVPSSALIPSTAYTFSAYVRVSTGPVGVMPNIVNLDTYGGIPMTNVVVSSAAVGAWARVSGTFTTLATPPTNGYVLDILTTGGSLTETIDTSDWMLTQGPTVYNYGDGSSLNWIWNGPANAASSTGPPL